MCCTNSRVIQSRHWTKWRASKIRVTGWSHTPSRVQNEQSQCQQHSTVWEFHPEEGSTTRMKYNINLTWKTNNANINTKWAALPSPLSRNRVLTRNWSCFYQADTGVTSQMFQSPLSSLVREAHVSLIGISSSGEIIGVSKQNKNHIHTYWRQLVSILINVVIQILSVNIGYFSNVLSSSNSNNLNNR